MDIRFQGIKYIHGPKDKVDAEMEKLNKGALPPSIDFYTSDLDAEVVTQVLLDGQDCLAFYEDFGIDTKAPGIFLGRLVKDGIAYALKRIAEEEDLPEIPEGDELEPLIERDFDLAFEYIERTLAEPDAAKAHERNYLARYQHTDISGKPVLHVIV